MNNIKTITDFVNLCNGINSLKTMFNDIIKNRVISEGYNISNNFSYECSIVNNGGLDKYLGKIEKLRIVWKGEGDLSIYHNHRKCNGMFNLTIEELKCYYREYNLNELL